MSTTQRLHGDMNSIDCPANGAGDAFYALAAEDQRYQDELRAASAGLKGKILDAEARPFFDAMRAQTEAPDGVQFEHGEVAGVPGIWVRSEDAISGAAILFLHGGGYVLGSAAATAGHAAQIAARAGVACFVADYRLAPEAPYPAALEDATAVLRTLKKTNDRVVLAGDSAGGGLALALAAHEAGVAAVAAMSPWTDLSLGGESFSTRAEADPIFTPAPLRAFAQAYLAGRDPRTHGASPLFADLGQLPPIRLDVGNDEVLLDDAIRFAAAARAAGRSAELHVWQGMAHVFQCDLRLAAARASLDGISGFLRANARAC